MRDICRLWLPKNRRVWRLIGELTVLAELMTLAVRPGAVDEARRLTPSIPVIGEYGIAIMTRLTSSAGAAAKRAQFFRRRSPAVLRLSKEIRRKRASTRRLQSLRLGTMRCATGKLV